MTISTNQCSSVAGKGLPLFFSRAEEDLTSQAALFLVKQTVQASLVRVRRLQALQRAHPVVVAVGAPVTLEKQR